MCYLIWLINSLTFFKHEMNTWDCTSAHMKTDLNNFCKYGMQSRNQSHNVFFPKSRSYKVCCLDDLLSLASRFISWYGIADHPSSGLSFVLYSVLHLPAPLLFLPCVCRMEYPVPQPLSFPVPDDIKHCPLLS